VIISSNQYLLENQEDRSLFAVSEHEYEAEFCNCMPVSICRDILMRSNLVTRSLRLRNYIKPHLNVAVNIILSCPQPLVNTYE